MKAIYLLLVSYIFLCTQALGESNENHINIVADEDQTEVFFNWHTDRCFDNNIPDSPARAFHSYDGKVYLYTAHYENVPYIGSTLDNARPACGEYYSAAMDSSPELYNSRIWLQTFYAVAGGKIVYSLASSDYHGIWFKNCLKVDPKNPGCWSSAVVLANSNDGGRNFDIAKPPNHIIARSPYLFSKERGGPSGFFTTSNIVKRGDYYYSLFYAGAYKQQLSGNCLARTNNLSDPRSWRSWDGKKFDTPFPWKALQGVDGQAHFSCMPIDGLNKKIRSLLWHEISHKYIAIFEEIKKSNSNMRLDVLFNYATSDDLINWSKTRNIISIQGPENCKTPQFSAAYPSILDSNSKDINFGTIDSSGYLYYTHFNLSDNCQLTLNRDLLRVPIKIHP